MHVVSASRPFKSEKAIKYVLKRKKDKLHEGNDETHEGRTENE